MGMASAVRKGSRAPLGIDRCNAIDGALGKRRGWSRPMNAAASPLSADDVVRLLDLRPHPEGGHYREALRDPATVGGGRSASSAIFFLLKAGEVSRWHRVDAVEVWHWYAGAALALAIVERGIRRDV